MNANEARNKANKINESKLRDEWAKVSSKIEAAVTRGEYETKIHEKLIPATISQLRGKGFDVTEESYQEDDTQRGGFVTTIKWI